MTTDSDTPASRKFRIAERRRSCTSKPSYFGNPLAFSIRFRHGLQNVYQLIRQRKNSWLTAFGLLAIHNNLPFIQVYLFPRDFSSFTDATPAPIQEHDERTELFWKHR